MTCEIMYEVAKPYPEGKNRHTRTYMAVFGFSCNYAMLCHRGLNLSLAWRLTCCKWLPIWQMHLWHDMPNEFEFHSCKLQPNSPYWNACWEQEMRAGLHVVSTFQIIWLQVRLDLGWRTCRSATRKQGRAMGLRRSRTGKNRRNNQEVFQLAMMRNLLISSYGS